MAAGKKRRLPCEECENEEALQPGHDGMLRSYIRILEERGFRVEKASHIQEFRTMRPSPVGGHTPDVEAIHPDGTALIGEVETCKALGREHTADQWVAFGRVLGVAFEVAVPEDCIEEAYERGTRLDGCGRAATLRRTRARNRTRERGCPSGRRLEPPLPLRRPAPRQDCLSPGG